MKATINGVTVEGTPQEIAEYQRIVNGYKPQQTYDWVPFRPSITCGGTEAMTKEYVWNGPVANLLREA